MAISGTGMLGRLLSPTLIQKGRRRDAWILNGSKQAARGEHAWATGRDGNWRGACAERSRDQYVTASGADRVDDVIFDRAAKVSATSASRRGISVGEGVDPL